MKCDGKNAIRVHHQTDRPWLLQHYFLQYDLFLQMTAMTTGLSVRDTIFRSINEFMRLKRNYSTRLLNVC